MIELKQKEIDSLAHISFLEYKKITFKEQTARLASFSKDIICGTTPSTKDCSLWNGDVPFITVDAMANRIFTTTSTRTITKKAYINSNRNVHKDFIMVSCIGTVGVVSLASKDSQTNQQINSINPIDKFKYFLFWSLKEKKEELQLLSKSGSATPNVNKETFSKILIKTPDDISLRDFNKIAFPLFSKILVIQNEIDCLNKQRNLLLKKYFCSE